MQEKFFIVRTFFYFCVMSYLTEITRTQMQKLRDGVPVRLEVDLLQEAAEIVMLKGLQVMEEIIDTSDNAEARIKALNTTINCGRYLERRKENQSAKPQRLVFDESYKVVQHGMQEKR